MRDDLELASGSLGDLRNWFIFAVGKLEGAGRSSVNEHCFRAFHWYSTHRETYRGLIEFAIIA